jgi:5-formaminoimidazole-4-carboxamide-1-beta-D-ribofuranosyl 5'-monophosphate synthetase
MRSSWLLHERDFAKIEISNDVSTAKFKKKYFASDFVECYELSSNDRRFVRFKNDDDSKIA